MCDGSEWSGPAKKQCAAPLPTELRNDDTKAETHVRSGANRPPPWRHQRQAHAMQHGGQHGVCVEIFAESNLVSRQGLHGHAFRRQLPVWCPWSGFERGFGVQDVWVWFLCADILVGPSQTEKFPHVVNSSMTAQRHTHGEMWVLLPDLENGERSDAAQGACGRPPRTILKRS